MNRVERAESGQFQPKIAITKVARLEWRQRREVHYANCATIVTTDRAGILILASVFSGGIARSSSPEASEVM